MSETDTLATVAVQQEPPAASQHTVRSQWPIVVALSIATAVVTLDNTVLNVALPSIARSLHSSTSGLQWIGNAYSLLFGGLLLTGGNLADRLGRRKVLLAGLAAFGAASALVVFVHGTGEVIALRALIGAAAAFVMPSTLALMFRLFEGPARATAMGVWGMIGALGFVGGPLLGGVILDHLSWHAVFLINVPVAAVAFVAIRLTTAESADPTDSRPDLMGTVLSVITMFAFVYTLITGPDDGWTSPRVLAAAALTAVALIAFVRWELRAPHPMLPIHHLRHASFAGPAVAEAVLMFSAFGSLFLLTQHLQIVSGYSPFDAGLRSAPIAAGTLITGPLVNLSARRFGTHWTAGIGYLMGAAGLVAIAIGLRHGYLPLAAGMVLIGGGLRMSITPVAIALVDALPKERAGMGSALNDTFQEIGGALGVALLGSIFNVVYRQHLPPGASAAVRSSIVNAVSQPDVALAAHARFAFDAGMQTAAFCCAALMAAVAVLAVQTLPHSMDLSEG
jgi:EmrB/QacA subfamily drug resistance transporter